MNASTEERDVAHDRLNTAVKSVSSNGSGTVRSENHLVFGEMVPLRSEEDATQLSRMHAAARGADARSQSSASSGRRSSMPAQARQFAGNATNGNFTLERVNSRKRMSMPVFEEGTRNASGDVSDDEDVRDLKKSKRRNSIGPTNPRSCSVKQRHHFVDRKQSSQDITRPRTNVEDAGMVGTGNDNLGSKVGGSAPSETKALKPRITDEKWGSDEEQWEPDHLSQGSTNKKGIPDSRTSLP